MTNRFAASEEENREQRKLQQTTNNNPDLFRADNEDLRARHQRRNEVRFYTVWLGSIRENIRSNQELFLSPPSEAVASRKEREGKDVETKNSNNYRLELDTDTLEHFLSVSLSLNRTFCCRLQLVLDLFVDS